MRLAIIGASDEAIHTIRCARELGIETIALDGDPEAEGLKEADIPIVVDITNEEATTDIIKKLGTDWVQTVPIGRYLTTTGAVNDALDLPGITKDMALKCTDKYAFHKALSSAGLRNCHCALVRGGAVERIHSVGGTVRSDVNIVDQATLLSHHGFEYPVILKPRYGSGSRGILTVENEEDLRSVFEDLEDVDEDYIIEECVNGEEYGVDAAVIQGDLHVILIRYKINTSFPVRQAVAYISVDPGEEVYGRIAGYLSKVVDTLGLDECLLHADVIDAGNSIFAIEVSARPSGHNLHNLFTPMVTGVDMAKEYMKYRMGESYLFDPAYTKMMMIHYFDMEGTVEKVPDKDAAKKAAEDCGGRLADWKCNILAGDQLEPVISGHSLMYRGYYITELTDKTRADEIVKRIRELFV